MDVCHLTDNGSTHTINVSVNALPDHRGHGDGLIGELVPSDASKVFDANCQPAEFGIDLEKATSGEDADAAPGPVLLVGAEVIWTYVVTNTGAVALRDVAVSDDQLGAVGCDGQTTLAAGAAMTCTVTGTVAAQPEQYANTGTVSAGPDLVTDPLATVATADDTDPSHYFAANPGVSLEKSTNGEDADVQADGPSLVEGGTVEWNYEVTNTGNVDLTNVVVTDAPEGEVCTAATLTAGGSLTCSATSTATLGDYANTGSVSGDFSDDAGNTESPSESDQSHYTGESQNPVIAIEKRTQDASGDFQDADTGTGPALQLPTIVSWAYEVTNDGNVDLADVIVTDNQNVAVDCGEKTTLAVGESMTCSASDDAVAGQYQNIGTATGTSAAWRRGERIGPKPVLRLEVRGHSDRNGDER